MNEKAAPEILHFQTREQIQLMVLYSKFSFFLMEDPEETVEEFGENGTDPLTVSLYQMNLDRTQFLLRSYLQIRLQKIEKYMFHILKTDVWSWLSEQEQKFAKRCTDDMERHLEQSVLSRLPDGYQSILKQSVASEEDDMVPEPRLDTFVFYKSKGSIEAFQLDDSKEVVDLVADDLYILRYNSVNPLIESGQIDLV
ncbi:unnamed protein product, partial [Vitis vinifera]